MKILSLTLLLFLSFTLLAQTEQSEKKPEKPYIEITGTAEKEIIPDEIYIAITIKERLEGRENITIEKQESALKQALISIGIDLKDLSLADADANYIRVRWTKRDVITKTEYLLKVGDAATVGKVFEKLDELKIQDAYVSKVDHSKIEELKKEVRVMAIKAAKEKSDYLLSAIGEQTGKPLIVKETVPIYDENRAFRFANVSQEVMYERPDLDKSKTFLEFKKIRLEAQIYVKFEIK